MAAKGIATAKMIFTEAVDSYRSFKNFDYVTPIQPFLDEPISESDRSRVQDSCFKTRFDLDSNYSLKQAFEAADIDPRDPSAPEILLRLLAKAIFPQGKTTRGRKRQWTPERWTQLLSDYDQVKSDHPSVTDQRICAKLITRFPSRYAGIRAETVRRNLTHARDVSKNKLLADLAEQISALIKLEFPKLVPPTSRLKVLSQKSAVRWLSKAWQRGRN
jgi:hypothetical protein